MFSNKRAVQENWRKKVMVEPIVSFFKHLDIVLGLINQILKP